MAIGRKQLSELRDLSREVISLDDPVRPHAAQELLFAEDRAVRLEESHQRVERPATQLHRSTVDQQLPAMADDLEPAELYC
jgi:hypothetical protein